MEKEIKYNLKVKLQISIEFVATTPDVARSATPA